MKRVGLIGRGRIARGFALAVASGQISGWELAGALARPRRPEREFPCAVFDDRQKFFGQLLDLVVETGGPAALAEYGPEALTVADVWSVSASALADPQLVLRLTAVGQATGHRLRLVSGSGGGLDSVAAHALLPGTKVSLKAEWLAEVPEGTPTFSGSAREAVTQFRGINSMAAVALAGTGLDATHIDYVGDVEGARRRFTIVAEGQGGRFTAVSEPQSDPVEGPRVVIASLVAALKRETEIIWCG